MMEARAFLESVAGYTRDTTADSSANAPVKIGTIDAAYPGSGLPKVKFDGESTTSVKPYPFLDSYLPVATDRVVLVPVGNTYLIVGRIDTTIGNLVSRVAALEAVSNPFRILTVRANAGVTLPLTTLTDIPGATITFTTTVANVRVLVDGVFDARRNATAGQPNFLGQCVVDGVAQTAQAVWNSAQINSFAMASNFWDVTLGAAGSHTIKLAAASNAAAQNVVQIHTGLKLQVFG